MSPHPSPEHPKPGEAASRVTDADLVGFQVRDCITAAERYRLTPRQRDVLFLSLCDKCPKEIGGALDRETSYVRVVRAAVVRRLQVHDGMTGIRRRVAEIARERRSLAGGGGRLNSTLLASRRSGTCHSMPPWSIPPLRPLQSGLQFRA